MDSKGIDLLLIGSSGSGKSATGNSILGREAFKRNSQGTPETHSSIISRETCIYKGNTIAVVDGLSMASSGSYKKKDQESIDLAIQLCNNGFTALLIVLKFGMGLSKEDTTVLETLKSVLGKNVIREYGICVVTFKENYLRALDNGEFKDLKDWCKKQVSGLKNLLAECDYRCVMLNNKTKDRIAREEQREELIHCVMKLSHHGSRRYSGKVTQQVKESGGDPLKLKISQLEKDIRAKIVTLQASVKNIVSATKGGFKESDLEALNIEIRVLEDCVAQTAFWVSQIKDLREEVAVNERSANQEGNVESETWTVVEKINGSKASEISKLKDPLIGDNMNGTLSQATGPRNDEVGQWFFQNLRGDEKKEDTPEAKHVVASPSDEISYADEKLKDINSRIEQSSGDVKQLEMMRNELKDLKHLVQKSVRDKTAQAVLDNIAQNELAIKLRLEFKEVDASTKESTSKKSTLIPTTQETQRDDAQIASVVARPEVTGQIGAKEVIAGQGTTPRGTTADGQISTSLSDESRSLTQVTEADQINKTDQPATNGQVPCQDTATGQSNRSDQIAATDSTSETVQVTISSLSSTAGQAPTTGQASLPSPACAVGQIIAAASPDCSASKAGPVTTTGQAATVDQATTAGQSNVLSQITASGPSSAVDQVTTASATGQSDVVGQVGEEVVILRHITSAPAFLETKTTPQANSGGPEEGKKKESPQLKRQMDAVLEETRKALTQIEQQPLSDPIRTKDALQQLLKKLQSQREDLQRSHPKSSSLSDQNLLKIKVLEAEIESKLNNLGVEIVSRGVSDSSGPGKSDPVTRSLSQPADKTTSSGPAVTTAPATTKSTASAPAMATAPSKAKSTTTAPTSATTKSSTTIPAATTASASAKSTTTSAGKTTLAPSPPSNTAASTTKSTATAQPAGTAKITTSSKTPSTTASATSTTKGTTITTASTAASTGSTKAAAVTTASTTATAASATSKPTGPVTKSGRF